MELWIIFFSTLFTVIISRLITFAVLVWKILPPNALSNGKRYHHFVYGNFLIVLSALLAIGLNMSGKLLALFFGVGVGLVLDEFPHWTGNVKELKRNVPVIPGAIRSVLIFELVILFLVALKFLGII